MSLLFALFLALVESPSQVDAPPAKAKAAACCCDCPPNPLCPEAPTCRK
jgi:hypothetical protein